MGVGTILVAKRIFLLAFAEHKGSSFTLKTIFLFVSLSYNILFLQYGYEFLMVLWLFFFIVANIIKRAVEGPIDKEVAASYLQEHPRAEVIVDLAAASQLTRIRCPWVLLGNDSTYKLKYDSKYYSRTDSKFKI